MDFILRSVSLFTKNMSFEHGVRSVFTNVIGISQYSRFVGVLETDQLHQ